MSAISILSPVIALVFAPLLLGLINRTKAVFGGRTGQPLLQTYFDLWKLLQKGAVYSKTATWIFAAGPIVGLAAVLATTTMVPFAGAPALVAFPGDMILFAGFLGLMRFFVVVAALDTGSSFEGMGASREVQFSALAEPALLLALAVVALQTFNISLSGMMASLSFGDWVQSGPALALATAALLAVLLAENARIPVDDPNTHLELTMIHEVMVLDHGGPDLAFILYSSALKLWVLGTLLVSMILPCHTEVWWRDILVALLGMFGLAVAIGVIESIMARLRMLMVPQLLVGAGTLAGIALILKL
jgi:formate hydrogenlyase subunit 4